MKQFKKSKKLIALFLSVSMLTVMVGAIEAPEDAAPISDTYALETLPQNVRSVLQENDQIVSVQRDDELFSITTNNADGTKTATVFAIPVKYENENGEIELIDTAMVSNGILENIFQGYQYRNKANSFTAEFSTDVKKGIRMTTEDGSITMAPATATASLLSANAAPVTVTAAVEEAVENAEMNDAFVYENVFGSGTRIKYYNTLNGIKEDIILDQNIEKNRFDFEINTNGDIPMLTEDAAMIFVYDKDDPTEMKYRFGSLYAYDSYTGEASESGFRHLTEECYYELTDLGNSKYRVTVVVPAEWLNHPELVYPVTIDPSMNIANTASNIDDTYARESEPTKNYYLEERLRIGNYNGTSYTDGKCYTYLRHIFLPTLPANSYISSAQLKLFFRPNQTTAQTAAIWRITSAWTGSTLTWNNRPESVAKNDTNAAPTKSGTTYSQYLFYITYMVSTWYTNGSGKYGFMIAYNNQAAQDLNSLYSSDCGVADKLPVLTINYAELTTIPEGVYYIRNQNSGKYVDVAGKSTASGANVQQEAFHGGPSQQWKFTNAWNNWYTLSPQHATNMAMSVEGSKLTNGANVQLYTKHSGAGERFGFVKLSNGTYRILSGATNGTKMITVEGASTANGANIYQYANANASDYWYLEMVPPNKPFDANYPYSGKGSYTGDAAVNWYNNLLSTYSFDLRNETIYTFTGNNCNQFNVAISKFCDKEYTNEQREDIFSDYLSLAWEAGIYGSQYIPKVGPGISLILSLIDTTNTLYNINDVTTLETLNAVHNKINVFIYADDNNLKSNIKLTISLLKKDPIAGREVKITTNYGDKYVFSLDNTSYEELMVAACAYCESISTYKVAPQYTYFWET